VEEVVIGDVAIIQLFIWMCQTKKKVTVGGMKNSGRRQSGTISTVSSARSTTQGNSGTNTTIMNDNLYVYLNNLYFCSVSQLDAEEEGGSTAK
jgi:hypothetical protein